MENKGHEWEVMKINSRFITVDPDGQRPLSKREGQIRKILKNFNPDLVQLISVAAIDGKYYCFDGQLTTEVLRRRNGGEDLPVWCRVFKDMTRKECAELFLEQRGIVAKVTMDDKLRVLYNMDDPDTVRMHDLTIENGLAVNWTPDGNRNHVIGATAALKNEFDAFDDDAKYAMFCRIVSNAWGNSINQVDGNLLKGLGLFLRTYSVSETDLTHKLSLKLPIELRRNAAVDSSPGIKKYAIQILNAYNFKRSRGALPNKF